MSGPLNSARTAYESLEPFHVLAYFNPGLGAAQSDTGLDPYGFYVGARGAPLGDCSPSVVISTFYNFSPGLIVDAWEKARAHGLERVAARREQMLDEQLRDILGERVDDPTIAELAQHYADVAATLPMGGRSLAAAWAAASVPDTPHMALWHNIAILREWRGDNHIAVLVTHGLDGIDAAAFHEADLLDPTIRRRTLGKKMTLLTRGWTDADWEASIDRLVGRGLAERTDSGHRLTADGAALYDDIEASTDALGESVWSTPGLAETVQQTKPLVKAVIDAGVLPGTSKK